MTTFNPEEHVSSATGGMPAEGEHILFVSECEHGVAGTGMEYFEMTLCIAVGNDAEKEVWYQRYYTGKEERGKFKFSPAAGMLGNLCRAISDEPTKFGVREPAEFMAQYGRLPFVGELQHEEYETKKGDKKIRVVLDKRTVRRLTPEELDMVREQVGSSEESFDDDDMPF